MDAKAPLMRNRNQSLTAVSTQKTSLNNIKVRTVYFDLPVLKINLLFKAP